MASLPPLITVEPVPPAMCGQEEAGAAGGGDSGVRLLRLNNTQVERGARGADARGRAQGGWDARAARGVPSAAAARAHARQRMCPGRDPGAARSAPRSRELSTGLPIFYVWSFFNTPC